MARIKHLVHIDLNQNQLQNAALQTLTAHPTNPSPVDGQIYYNTSTKKAYIYEAVGSDWMDLNQVNTVLTNAQVRAATAAATNSQVFTDADHTKLNGIDTSADVNLTTAQMRSAIGTGNGNLVPAAAATTHFLRGDGTFQDISALGVTLTEDQVDDFAAGMFTSATHTGITSVYNDTAGTVTLAVANADKLAALDTQAQIDTAIGLKANIAGPAFTGAPTAVTASTTTNTTQLATTAFVRANIAALVDSADGVLDTLGEISDALGDDANYAATITSALALKAPKASPTFTGAPLSTTPGTSDNTTKIATTAYVKAQGYTGATDISAKADIASPTFTGTVVLPNVPAIVTTALNLKANLAGPTFSGTVGLPGISNLKTAVDANTAKTSFVVASSVEAGALSINTKAITPLTFTNAAAALKYKTALGDGTDTSFNVDHGLGMREVRVQLYDAVTYETVIAQVVRSTTARVVVTFNTPPASNNQIVCLVDTGA